MMNNVKVVGYHLGERFDLQKLRRDLTFSCLYEDPTELIYTTGEQAFFQCFDYGSLVFFGVAEPLQATVCSDIQRILDITGSGWHVERLDVEIREDAPYRSYFDKIVLKEVTPDIAKILMINIAQSVALDYYTGQSNVLIDEITGFCTELEERGTYSLKGRRLLRYIGRALNLRNRIASNLYIFDNPQLTWNDEFLNVVNTDLQRELDITLRYKSLQYNLDTVKENLEMFKDLHQHSHSATLEWIIIILIAIEVVAFGWELMM